jgi:hypothetical protein
MEWRVVVPWPANNKFILEEKIQGLPDVDPEVQGALGAQYFVTVYLPSTAASDEDEARRRGIDRLTEILGETEPRNDQIPVDKIEASLVESRTPQAQAPALEREIPLDVEEVPVTDDE